MTNNEPDYKEDLCFENNKIQPTGIDDIKIQANLTEKWKKGELPAGYYYIEAITGEKIIDFMPYNEKEFKIFPSHTSIVICEVPSYEEWKQLKELLMQSRIYVKIDTEDYEDRTVSKVEKAEARKLLNKIDEVLK